MINITWHGNTPTRKPGAGDFVYFAGDKTVGIVHEGADLPACTIGESLHLKQAGRERELILMPTADDHGYLVHPDAVWSFAQRFVAEHVLTLPEILEVPRLRASAVALCAGKHLTQRVNMNFEEPGLNDLLRAGFNSAANKYISSQLPDWWRAQRAVFYMSIFSEDLPLS